MPLGNAALEVAAHAGGHLAGAGAAGPSGLISRTSSYGMNYLFRNLVPGPGELLDAYRRGLLSLTDVQKALGLHGIAFFPTGGQPDPGWLDEEKKAAKLWKAAYNAGRILPTDGELLVLWNRYILSQDQVEWYRQAKGWENAQIWGEYNRLRNDVPGPSDLVRFSVRHAFEPDLIQRFGFDAEKRDSLDWFHQQQGMGWNLLDDEHIRRWSRFNRDAGLSDARSFGEFQRAGFDRVTWADMYWWSHWVWPSPTQSYMFLQQLRPGRHRERFPNEEEHPQFTVEDLNYMLRGNDYPPSFRPLLRAISYRVPGFRQVRQMREQDVIDQQEHREMYRDMGYSLRDATNLEQSDYRKILDTRNAKMEREARGALEKAWELGAISDDEFFQRLEQSGLTREEAQQTLQLALATRRMQLLQRVQRHVHRQYIRGQITRTDAQTTLTNVGMEQTVVSTRLTEWDIELNGDVRLVSAQKAVKWACDGIIDLPSLVSRLRNLHYLEPDIEAWVAEAAQCVAGRAARAAAQRVRDERQRVRDLRRAIVEGRADIRWNQGQLARSGTQEQLANWYWQGLIPLGAVNERLTGLGYQPADIERHLLATKPGKPPGGQPRRD